MTLLFLATERLTTGYACEQQVHCYDYRTDQSWASH